jgi:16S rRNA (cytosine1402-N4)-methyltransferase
MIHKSVLLNEAIQGLDIREGDIFLDCTLGNGGHSLEVFKRFGTSVKIVGLDADSDAIARSAERLASFGCEIIAVAANFRHVSAVLDGLDIPKVDRVLMDLGLSSNQIEESGRGFTFQKDEPLLMTFSNELGDGSLTAQAIVNFWDEENLETILRAYGEERFARRIARGIVAAREAGPIETTGELVEIVARSVPAVYRHGRIHFATRTFQALRMTVNDELQALAEGMEQAFERLNVGGRLAVISFHSGEDRIVKNFFRAKAAAGAGRLIAKKPLSATDEEIAENPRSRSAKLRIVEKIGEGEEGNY